MRIFFPPHISVYISDRNEDFKLNSPEVPFSSQQKSFWDSHKLPAALAQIHQVHGDKIIQVKSPVDHQSAVLAEADGLVSNLTDCGLAVRTADCLSAFFYDPTQDAIGICHAGWKGTREEIAVQTIEAMQKAFGTKPWGMLVAFGPCIRANSYEVSGEFKKYFPRETKEVDGKFYFDLAEANRRQLSQKGVKPHNMIDCNVDTFTDQTCFSFRKEAESAGRMLSVIFKN